MSSDGSDVRQPSGRNVEPVSHWTRRFARVLKWGALAYTVKHSQALLARCKVHSAFVFVGQLSYSFVALRACVFQAHLIRKKYPKVAGFLRSVGVEGFVLANQKLPCSKSHRGKSCLSNFFALAAAFWKKLFPLLCFYQIVTRTISGGSINTGVILSTFSHCLFLFVQTGLPGFIFCLTKKISGEGKILGIFVSALCGSILALNWPAQKRRKLLMSIAQTFLLVKLL